MVNSFMKILSSDLWKINYILKNGENVTSFRGMAFVARSLGGPWTGWIGPAPVQMSGCCLGAALSWLTLGLRDGLVQGLVVFSLTFRFFVNSPLDHSRAWIPACSPTAALCTAAFPQSFYNYARGHCEAARSFFRAMYSVYLISVEQ